MTSDADETTLIWLRPEPSGRKPRFSRAEIARTAIGIADADGFDAVTMKRIAAELGAGTMTLYYYVRNKADIVALMQDAIFEDVIVAPGELPAHWRDAVMLITRRTRDVLVGHPWAINSLNQAQFGPNAVAHYEQSLAALAATALSYPQKTEATAIVDDYVAGNAMHTIETAERLRAAAGNPGMYAEAKAYGDALTATGKFPELEALAEEHARNAGAPGEEIAPLAHLDRQFEIGLAALLDGIERHYGIG
jgi:AcrR family transcriptional regulator